MDKNIPERTTIIALLKICKDKDLAKKFNVSRQRIHQLRKQYSIPQTPSCAIHNEDRITEIMRMISENYTKQEIYKKLNMSIDTLEAILLEYDIPYKHKNRMQGRIAVDPEVYAEMKKRMSMKNIAKELGVSIQTLYRWRNNNVDISKK